MGIARRMRAIQKAQNDAAYKAIKAQGIVERANALMKEKKAKERVERKGEYGQMCNRTDCTTQKPAEYYNKSTRKYYCAVCADLINSFVPGQRDSMHLYGTSKLCEKPSEMQQV